MKENTLKHCDSMKGHLYILLALIIFSKTVIAQEHLDCGSDHERKKNILNFPNILHHEAELEDFTQKYVLEKAGNRDGQLYIIPVVFHVIHQYGEENISNDQIFDAMRILNEDFRKKNADTSEIIDEFVDIAADAHIEFRLAGLDFMGNCTNGIERIASVETYVGDNGSKLHQWPRHRYLNIWVVASMPNGMAGFSQYPSSVIDYPMAMIDGVIIRHDYVGSINTSNEYRSHALSHEVGHYLNLQHTWGDTNIPGISCGDDDVNDTPETKGWTSCYLDSIVCVRRVFENVQNFMEYSYCSNMFTDGQVTRMHAALNSTVSLRSSLWQESTLLATGTFLERPTTCQPIVDFYPEYPIVCIGEEVQFFDNSTNADPTSWLWYFNGAINTSSSEKHPVVIFDSPGWKSVSLTVSNDEGSSSKTVSQCILVTPDYSEVDGLLSESFESEEYFNNAWVVRNLEGDLMTWSRTSEVGFDDNTCVKLNAFDREIGFFDDDDNDINDLITPSMDLSDVHNADFSFRYAFATSTSDPDNFKDKLIVYSTSNCGRSWHKLLTLSSTDLITAGNWSQSFSPQSAEEWKFATFSIPISQEQVRFKFRFISGSYGNNLYIDNVRIEGLVAVDELCNDKFIRVYPNPSDENLTLDLFCPKGGVATIFLSDACGRTIRQEPVNCSIGNNDSINLDISGLSPGTYQLTCIIDEKKANKMIIIR